MPSSTHATPRPTGFFRDVLGFSSVDAGGGWLIFAAPPSELACHPAESNGKHELYLMCDDLRAEIARLGEKGIACGPVSDQGWGLLQLLCAALANPALGAANRSNHCGKRVPVAPDAAAGRQEGGIGCGSSRTRGMKDAA